VSCTKTAELIEMQFGMLTRVGPGSHVLHGGVDGPAGRSIFGGVLLIEKHYKA